MRRTRLLIVVVPRHPQRFDEVARWADARRSAAASFAGASDRGSPRRHDGRDGVYYAACDVAVIGGSFLPLGGQNLIEALRRRRAGGDRPEHVQFRRGDARSRSRRGAAIQAARRGGGAARRRCELLRDAGAPRSRWRRRGRRLCEAHRGATDAPSRGLPAPAQRGQGAVDFLEVLFAQRAGGGLQAQVVEDGVVARQRQVALGRRYSCCCAFSTSMLMRTPTS